MSTPKRRLGFKDKLKWTGISLILFYVLSEIGLFGVQSGAAGDIFGDLKTIVASSFGTLMTLGIGPIVTASIVLQLLSGAGVFKFDTSTEEGRNKFQGLQKILSLLFTFFEAIILLVSGQIPGSPELMSVVGDSGVFLLLLTQLVIGVVIVMLLDELIT